MDRKGVGRVRLALKGVMLEHPWSEDHDAYKVGSKMFALISALGGLSFKASDIAFEVLIESGRARPVPYLARTNGCISKARTTGRTANWPTIFGRRTP